MKNLKSNFLALVALFSFAAVSIVTANDVKVEVVKEVAKEVVQSGAKVVEEVAQSGTKVVKEVAQSGIVTKCIDGVKGATGSVVSGAKNAAGYVVELPVLKQVKDYAVMPVARAANKYAVTPTNNFVHAHPYVSATGAAVVTLALICVIVNALDETEEELDFA